MDEAKKPSYAVNTVIVVVFVIACAVTLTSFLYQPLLRVSSEDMTGRGTSTTNYYYLNQLAGTDGSVEITNFCDTQQQPYNSTYQMSYLQTYKNAIYNYLIQRGVGSTASVVLEIRVELTCSNQQGVLDENTITVMCVKSSDKFDPLQNHSSVAGGFVLVASAFPCSS